MSESMYVAGRRLVGKKPDGTNAVFNEGEPVPDWVIRESQLQHMLKHGMLRRVDHQSTPPPALASNLFGGLPDDVFV